MASEITPITATRDQYTKIPIKGSATFGPDIQVFVTEMDLDAEKTNLIKVQMNTLSGQVNTNAQEAEAAAVWSAKWAYQMTEVTEGLYAAKAYAVGTVPEGSAKDWAHKETEVAGGFWSAMAYAFGEPPGGSAKAHRDAAQGFAEAAAAWAEKAANGSTFGATSDSAVTIGPGAKVFTLNETNRAFIVGTYVKAVNPVNTDQYIQGNVTGYVGDVLTVESALSGGTGDVSAWNIMIAVEGDASTVGGMTAEGILNAAAGGGAVITATVDVVLTATSPRAMSILPVSADKDIILPNATTLRLGATFSIFSIGFYDLIPKNHGGSADPFWTIGAGAGLILTLVDNSTVDGVWQMIRTTHATYTEDIFSDGQGGQFVVLPGVYQLHIDLNGGGGGGGSYTGVFSGGGGGGAGKSEIVLDVEPGDIITYVAGRKGVGYAANEMGAGTAGTTTTLTFGDTIVTCTGGQGGSGTAGGVGGTAIGGDTNTDGTAGDGMQTASPYMAYGGIIGGGMAYSASGADGIPGKITFQYYKRGAYA